MKRTKTLASLLLVVLLLAVSVAPAFAASAYTGKAGTSYRITETLKLEKADTIVPTVSYKLALVNKVPLTESGGPVNTNAYSGTPSITTDTVSFSSASTVRGTGTNYGRYVTGDFVIDFTTVTFYEPGVYRYNLTKTMTTDEASEKITNNRGTDYVLIYVASDANTATLQNVVYVHDNKTETVNGTAIGKEYLDRYRSSNHHLFVSKTVTGNMGSKSQYFQFTINLTGGVADSKYEVSGTYQAATEVTAHNDQSYNNATLLGLTPGTDADGNEANFITLDENGAYTGTVWMRHGQSLTIEELAQGISYTVSEANGDYTKTLSSSSAKETGKIPADGDVQVAYVNTKEITPPTGINLQVLAPVFGIALVSLLLAVVLLSKRRENH